MSSQNVTFVEDEVWAIESPLDVVAGESIIFACTFWGTATSPAAAAYRRNQIETPTVFPTNTPSGTGTTIITLSPATGLRGGGRYVIAVTVTINSNVYIRSIMLKCRKVTDEQ